MVRFRLLPLSSKSHWLRGHSYRRVKNFARRMIVWRRETDEALSMPTAMAHPLLTSHWKVLGEY